MDIRFPEALTKHRNWVCWKAVPDQRKGRIRKVPMNARTGQAASSTDSATWCSVEEALEGCKRFLYLGVGFVFTPETGLVGVDIDHCIDPQTHEWNETARAVYERCPTYAEYSPSGTGLHLFYFGAMPGKGNKNSVTGVEMYGDTRYFTMTGKRVNGCPDMPAQGGDALIWIHETYVASKRTSKRKKVKRRAAALTDEALLEKARAAQNGELFNALWENQWQGLIETDDQGEAVLDGHGKPKPKYTSQSEADMALCCLLAFWTGKNREQMERLFRQSALMRPKWDEAHFAGGVTYGNKTLDDAIAASDTVYSPDSEPSIVEQNGRYFRVKGDSVYPITNFIIRPLEMVESEDEAQMTCDLETINGETFRQTFMSADFSNVQRFKGVLNKRTISLCYTGGDGDLEMFKEYVAGLDWDRKRGVECSGFLLENGKWQFVAGNAALDSTAAPLDDIVQPEKYVGLETGILEAEAISADTLRDLGLLLLRYNVSAKTVAVLAWCAGCFVKEHLRQAHVKYPHLFLIGEAGSGKSNTLERVILPIFARTRVNAATQVTAFTLMKESASSNCIPQALDEFKPSKTDRQRLNWLYNHMRDSYDGHAGLRGRADQTQVSYDLLAPLVIAGEQSPDEAAVRERGLELLFSKKDIHDAETREAFLRLAARPERLAGFGRGLLETALGVQVAEVTAWHEAALQLFNPNLPSRILSNLAAAMCGLRLAERLCHRLGLQWGQVFPASLEECAKFLGFGVHEYLLDGGESNKTVVEQTLEVFDRMKLGPEVVHLSEDGKELGLYIKDIYDLFTQYVKDHAVDGERLTKAEFIRQLKQTEFYLGSKSVRFTDRVKQAHVLDYTILRQRCDVSGFGEMPPPLCKM